MTKIFSRSIAIQTDIVDAFCALQKGFTDQFVYYDKEHPTRYMGLGRCIALPSLEDVEYEYEGACDAHGEQVVQGAHGEQDTQVPHTEQSTQVPHTEQSACDAAFQPAIFFSFNRFDEGNSAPMDDLMASFPHLRFMLPEVVLIEDEHGRFLQVNSLGPVYEGRIARFARMCEQAPERAHASIPFQLEEASRDEWHSAMNDMLDAIDGTRVNKVVLSRRQKLVADNPFSSKDLLVNLIDGDAHGVVIMYRYADVFFCGCTPELLVRKHENTVETMCLAGTCPAGDTDEQRARNAEALMADAKNRAEHDYVVRFVESVLDRVCYNVDIPDQPQIMSLSHVQHLYTPARACVLEGVDLWTLVQNLHPTPATSGAPVGEAKMIIRRVEPYGRGLYAGAAGIVDGNGDGEFSVALRTGVFDGEIGWVYAGCGVVSESDPDEEFEEVSLKLKTVLSAFDAPAAAVKEGA